jgi:HNH endonuclease
MYARAEKLAAFGRTSMTRKVDDAATIARTTGTSMGQAKATLETAKVLRESPSVSAAFGGGDISFEQASVIAKADKAKPGAADELLKVAKGASFNVLREESRKVVLEAEQHRGLGERQREARAARHYADDLGMVNLHLRMPPTLGTAIVNRAEDDARRLQREARREGRAEPYERHLADAFASMLSGAGTKGRTKRPELVVLVSHEVAKRGWADVREGEVCKIPGVGPVPPQEAKEIARDALVTAITTEGKDFRLIKRWSHDFPVEVRLALELGEPPEFDGMKCFDCGNRFRNQRDHVEPHVAGGLASVENAKPRCYECHQVKTENDRKAGKLKPRPRPPDESEADDRAPPDR